MAISRSKLYELLASGVVASIRIDGSRRIPLAALEDLHRQSSPGGSRSLMSVRDGLVKRGKTWSYVVRVKILRLG